MKYSITAYPRTYVVRIDLRLPEDDLSLDFLSRDEIVGYNQNRKNLMKKFTESLNAKIKAQGIRKYKEGKRVYPCTNKVCMGELNENY